LPERRVHCPDGSVRTVFRDHRIHLRMEGKRRSATFSAQLKVLEKTSASLAGQYAADYPNILKGLRGQTQDMVLSYHQNYLRYHFNPCGGYEDYNAEVGRLNLWCHGLKDSLDLLAGWAHERDGEKFLEAFTCLIMQYGLMPAARTATDEIQKARRVVLLWVDEQDEE
jgi:hypothetical protein